MHSIASRKPISIDEALSQLLGKGDPLYGDLYSYDLSTWVEFQITTDPQHLKMICLKGTVPVLKFLNKKDDEIAQNEKERDHA